MPTRNALYLFTVGLGVFTKKMYHFKVHRSRDLKPRRTIAILTMGETGTPVP